MPTLVGGQRREGRVRTRVTNAGVLTIEQDFHFRIRADSLDQDRYAILHTTAGVPTFGVEYGGLGMRLKGADANRRDDDPFLWDAVYNLSNEVTEGENADPGTGGPQAGLPTEWLAVVTLGFEDNDEVFRRSLPIPLSQLQPDLPQFPGGTDPDGYNAVNWTNSAGEFYSQGFIRQQRIITREFVQFEPISGPSALTLDDIEARNDVLNDDEFLGKPKRTLKLTVESCEAGFYYSLRCWRVGYKLHYRQDDWRLKQLDTGSYYFDATGQRVNLSDEDDRPLSENPFRGALDGKGGKVADQLDPAIRYHKEFEEIDFEAILRMA